VEQVGESPCLSLDTCSTKQKQIESEHLSSKVHLDLPWKRFIRVVKQILAHHWSKLPGVLVEDACTFSQQYQHLCAIFRIPYVNRATVNIARDVFVNDQNSETANVA